MSDRIRGLEDPTGAWAALGHEAVLDAHLRRLRGNPTEVLRDIAMDIATKHDLEVDHASFDAVAAYANEPLVPRSYWTSVPLGQGFDPCDDVHPHRWTAPREPVADATVYYRGWEIGWSRVAWYWSGEGWIAYKGGCDLDAREVRSATYQGCLDAIDDEEDE